MTQMPVLLPLQCIKCQTAIQAEPEEVAWLCANCGQGLLLDEKQASGLAALDIYFATGIQSGQRGRPFWVAQGLVSIQRQTYSGDEGRQAQEFWKTPRTFFVPAFACSLDELIGLGMRLLKQPVTMMHAQPAAFLPVTLLLDDVRPMAEFIIMGIEAERRDMMKSAALQLSLAKPALWVLPL
jgi:predicted RNA-binding Zn-ribbon protein involved in translation (DUF1610 family)